MRRKPKTELDPSEPYRSYRVLDGSSVPDATVPDATEATDDGPPTTGTNPTSLWRLS